MGYTVALLDREQWNEVVNQLESLGLDREQAMDDYSGRFMYGETCIAVTGTPGDLIKFIAIVSQYVMLEEIIDELAPRVKQDQFGTGFVYYFPGVKVVEGLHH